MGLELKGAQCHQNDGREDPTSVEMWNEQYRGELFPRVREVD